MTICLFEDAAVEHLYPITRTRGPYNLRVGIRTIAEIIEEAFEPNRIIIHGRDDVAQHVGRQYDLLANRIPEGLDVLFINGRLLAHDDAIIQQINQLQQSHPDGGVLLQDESVVAAWTPDIASGRLPKGFVDSSTFSDLPSEQTQNAVLIDRLWQLLEHLPDALRRDFRVRTSGYNVLQHDRADVRDGAYLINSEQIFLGDGVTVYPGTVLNAEDGPIYIDKDATIREQVVLNGPIYIGPRCVVKVGANIHTSSFGYWCKVAGEMHDVIFQQLSNKGHPGFLGHSIVGSWCNIGASTNNSNLKNDYGTVKLYNVPTETIEDTGQQYCGLFMGDHSKCGINSTFNTGTMIDVFCNLYGTGYHPKYVPPFTWGSPSDGYTSYRLEKAMEVADRVIRRRESSLSDEEREILEAIHAEWKTRERPS